MYIGIVLRGSKIIFLIYVYIRHIIHGNEIVYGVATISRLLKIIRLFGEYRSLL